MIGQVVAGVAPWVLAGWLAGWILLWRLPRLAERRSRGPRPPVAVVVPARDEADRIPSLLAGLVGQTGPADRVIVVDDDSTDGTAAVARSFAGVDVVTAAPLPDGWAGKPWACATGAAAARRDLLVFLDADVELGAGALDALVAAWEADGGLVSVQPHHRTVRAREWLSLPFNVVSVMGLGVGSLLPPRHEWGAAGPCLVTSRADYERVGGHRAVAGEVAEDLALARRYRDDGIAVTCLGGADLVRFRMYRDLRGLIEGWSKNLMTGARRTPLLRSAAIFGWVAALLSLALTVALGPGPVGWAPWSAVYLAGLGQIAVLGRQVGRFGVAALAWPLLMAFFAGVFLLSTVQTVVVRRVRWSGRRLPVSVAGAGDGRAPGRSAPG